MSPLSQTSQAGKPHFSGCHFHPGSRQGVVTLRKIPVPIPAAGGSLDKSRLPGGRGKEEKRMINKRVAFKVLMLSIRDGSWRTARWCLKELVGA